MLVWLQSPTLNGPHAGSQEILNLFLSERFDWGSHVFSLGGCFSVHPDIQTSTEVAGYQNASPCIRTGAKTQAKTGESRETEKVASQVWRFDFVQKTVDPPCVLGSSWDLSNIKGNVSRKRLKDCSLMANNSSY